ncbi:MAG: translation initiation factor [Verrucomicrobiota bacterium]
MSKKRKKLELDHPTDALNNAFSGLDIQGLDPGPSECSDTTEPELALKEGKKEELIQRKETAHRGGKTVIIVSGFLDSRSDEELAQLAARLKKSCGCGGTLKDREIEIQGEKAAEVANFLRKDGFRPRGVIQ